MNAAEKSLPKDARTTPIVPTKLAHYVIRAKHFPEMLAWYRQVFHLRTSFEAPVIAFLTYDEEHHRIAFLNTSHLPAPEKLQTGIDHVAFTYAGLHDLLLTYERLKKAGITPFWCINHGPTTSMYFWSGLAALSVAATAAVADFSGADLSVVAGDGCMK